MLVEAAVIKPVVDAILGLARAGKGVRLKANAETAVRAAILELLQADPNENAAAANIAIAKAAGVLSSDLILAETMLGKVRQHKAAAKRPAKKAARKRAKKKTAKKAAKKRSAKKRV